jgi:hypothetical protein
MYVSFLKLDIALYTNEYIQTLHSLCFSHISFNKHSIIYTSDIIAFVYIPNYISIDQKQHRASLLRSKRQRIKELAKSRKIEELNNWILPVVEGSEMKANVNGRTH